MQISAVLAFTIAAFLTWAGTAGARILLRRRHVLDTPNARSSHAVPTPRGAGLALVPVVLVGWLVTSWVLPEPDGETSQTVALTTLSLFLAAVSFADDVRGLPVGIRLLSQLAAVVAMLVLFPFEGKFTNTLLPAPVVTIFGVIAWLWFINLFNFMDGIDGIAGTETATIGFGIAGVATLTGLGSWPILTSVIIAGAALGFLVWNRPPARIFLGDVGSIPLGFLLGWLLLDLASRGQWAPALILPLYYLVDATLTLLKRALRRERIWQAHREHFYQMAVQRGASHGAVTLTIAVGNGFLIALSFLVAGAHLGVIEAVVCAFIVVALVILRLAFWPRS